MLRRWGVSVQATGAKAASTKATRAAPRRLRLGPRGLALYAAPPLRRPAESAHSGPWSWLANEGRSAPKRREFCSMSSNVATESEGGGDDVAASFGSDDEYNACAHAGAKSSTFRLQAPLALERGGELHGVEVAYTTYGTLNEARDNVIVLCHALTGGSLVHQYWESMVSSKWTDEYFIVCSNILGSCYGTTGPTSTNPATGKPYGASFPAITMRDVVQLQKTLLQHELGVEQVQCVIGGSLGGMTTLEWAFLGEDFVKSFVTIACGSHQSAWQISMGELQRQVIYMDPLFQNGDYDPARPPTQGLSLARQMAMMSYRSHSAYQEKFGRELLDREAVTKYDRFVVQSYLEYQGNKFLSRFDVNSYVALLHLMDTHDVGRNRGGVAHALSTLTQPALVVGVETDVLYPICEQRDIASALPRATFESISSIHGHDGFLLEQERISDLTYAFLKDRVN